MTPTLEQIPVDKIVERPQVRTRFDAEGINGLAQSIAESGLQQPILVYRDGDGFALIDGARRVRAHRHLGWMHVSALVLSDPVTVAEALRRQFVCNLQREDLNPLEEARGIARLMSESQLTMDAAAKSIGKSAAHVSKRIPLLKLPGWMQEAVETGKLSADGGYHLSRETDPKRQAELAADLMGGKLTRDSVARKIKRANRASAGTSAERATRVTAMMEKGRSVTLSGKGLSLDAVIELLEPLLTRAKRAKSQSLSLETFARAMRDQAGKAGAPA